jgi:thiosulfate dehydrogenase [quinone] large subunit
MTTDVNAKNGSSTMVAFEDPPAAKFLFGDTRMAWLWVILRVYIGWQWLVAGYDKMINPVWFGDKAGVAITGFVNGALAKTAAALPPGAHADVPAWYAWFLQNLVLPYAPFWSRIVTIGELLVGIGLILGMLTGIAAFFGSFMNFNYLLAGTVSVNPMMFAIATLLVLAWKTAGWWGLDRWVLPMFGTPWRPGKVFKGEPPGMVATPPASSKAE